MTTYLFLLLLSSSSPLFLLLLSSPLCYPWNTQGSSASNDVSRHQPHPQPPGPAGPPGPSVISRAPAWSSPRRGTAGPVSPWRLAGHLQRGPAHRALSPQPRTPQCA
ncbi:hypothetical protein CRUP_003734 [Coryphaenoides rupestris]|nr:hypothetical protein CRUP_003734 [Coryphaenoides rupestris]